MNLLAWVRAIHVLSIVIWIGGVAMVTLVLLSPATAFPSVEARMETFSRIERQFSRWAQVMVLLAGISGLYMLKAFNAWPRFAYPQYWWMHAMVGIWAIFALLLFVIEPLLLHRQLEKLAQTSPKRAWRFLRTMHWLLLTASLVTIAGTVAGSHGG